MPDAVGTGGVDARVAERLLDVAADSIAEGLAGRGPLLPDDELSPSLRRRVGSFVTLHVHGELNGCIGSIDGADSLAIDVARHAWSAAFDDPRLPALRREDLASLHTEISILSELEVVPSHTRADLAAVLRPEVDGLLVQSGRHRAVFLPAVWHTLPDLTTFVSQLLAKAGLDPDRWPDDMRAWCFTAEEIHR